MRLRATKKKDRSRRAHLKRGGWRADRIDQTCNVYDAENYGEATSDAVLQNKKEVRAFIAQIKKSKYWQKHNPWRKKHRVKFKGRSAWASGGRTGMLLPDQRWARSVHVVIHEMAHACHPNSECHGRKFCHSLLVLTREFEGAQFARLLRQRLYQTGALKRPRRRKK